MTSTKEIDSVKSEEAKGPTPWKGLRYPLYRGLGVPHSRSGRVWKSQNLVLTLRFKPRSVQPVGSRYTDYLIQAVQ